MAFHGDSKVVDVKGFEADLHGAEFARTTTSSDEDLSSPVQANPKRKWQSYIWDTLDKSPEERRLLFKLDAAVLTFATLGYFIKYLDQININNAFVSGMKEDLGLYKNQLNYMQTCWTVGYVIGEVPCEYSPRMCPLNKT
jgi:MFS transporter, ACS family, pantothenate transporter